MGFNPRPRTWTPDQWRHVAPTVGDLQRHSFPVFAMCAVCQLQMDVDLAKVAAALGPGYVLWGRSARCRRRRCEGRMYFWCRPAKAGCDVEMW